MQAGSSYGTVVLDGDGNQLWMLLAGCTLVEAAYAARERCPSSPHIIASFSRTHMVFRSGLRVEREPVAARAGCRVCVHRVSQGASVASCLAGSCWLLDLCLVGLRRLDGVSTSVQCRLAPGSLRVSIVRASMCAPDLSASLQHVLAVLRCGSWASRRAAGRWVPREA